MPSQIHDLAQYESTRTKSMLFSLPETIFTYDVYFSNQLAINYTLKSKRTCNIVLEKSSIGSICNFE